MPQPDMSRFSWRPPIYIFALTLALLVGGSFVDPDLFLLAYLVSVIPISVVLMAMAWSRRHPSAFIALLVYWALSALFLTYFNATRTWTRWLLLSTHYKTKVLAQRPAPGDMKHIEWDGWGWAGMNTSVFLVFDPADSLSQAARADDPGKLSGMQCEADVVRRLERNWYSVQLSTGEDWRDCQKTEP